MIAQIVISLSLIAAAAAVECVCDCSSDFQKPTEVASCKECTGELCKMKFPDNCTVPFARCEQSESEENFFTCDSAQLAEALACVFGLGSECPLLITPADSKYCSCKQKGQDCLRNADCKPNKQTEAQVAACKKECPDANYCNGAESLVASTIALVAALAALRI